MHIKTIFLAFMFSAFYKWVKGLNNSLEMAELHLTYIYVHICSSLLLRTSYVVKYYSTPLVKYISCLYSYIPLIV